MRDASIGEREQFSARLVTVLREAGIQHDSPTVLSREFNARYNGTPVTVHAARKWIVGEAIPTQAKLRALAAWLGVTPDWLRFGADAAQSAHNAQPMSTAHVLLIADFQRLDEYGQRVVREIVRTMVKLNSPRAEVV